MLTYILYIFACALSWPTNGMTDISPESLLFAHTENKEDFTLYILMKYKLNKTMISDYTFFLIGSIRLSGSCGVAPCLPTV